MIVLHISIFLIIINYLISLYLITTTIIEVNKRGVINESDMWKIVVYLLPGGSIFLVLFGLVIGFILWFILFLHN